MAKEDWLEHIIIRTISNKRKNPWNSKIASDLQVEHFTSPVYRTVWNRLSNFHEQSGRWLSWKEILNDTTLPDKVLNKIRSLEFKRRTISKKDSSLKLPTDYDEASFILSTLISRSQHVSLINFQNTLSDFLAKEKISSEDVKGIISLGKDKLDQIQHLKKPTGELVAMSDLSAKKYWERFKNKLKVFHVPTGFLNFDRKSVGIPKDSFFIIAANTGAGKSSMALQVAMNISRFGGRVCFVSLEMSFEQNLLRIISNLTGISKNSINSNPDLYYKQAIRSLKKFKKSFDNGGSLDFYTPEESISMNGVLNFLKPYNYDMIIIDYLTLLEETHSDQWRSLDRAGRYAKMFATINNTIVTGLAQWDAVSDNIRYAKALLEHGSNVWQWITTEEELRESGLINIRQVKARNQERFNFRLKFNPETSKIEDASYDDYDSSSENDEVPEVVDGFDRLSKKKKRKRNLNEE